MTTYKEAGVDQNANDDFVTRIRRLTRGLPTTGVIGGIGSFAGMVALRELGYRDPVLVAGTDGVGSKLEIAFALGNHHTIGIDLVAMSVNDVACHGARPIFFLDYMALGRLDMEIGEAIIAGIVEGCRQARCVLLGGETAQLPTFYKDGRYDLAGFAVGLVERDRIITGADIKPGDVIVGLPSSGPHSNGYSLIRKIVADEGLDLAQHFEDTRTLGETLLTPTRIYVPQIMACMDAGAGVKGIAHITGGGITGNFARVLPEGVGAVIRRGTWMEPAIFGSLQQWGSVDDAEMFDVFNMGLGLLMVASRDEADRIIDILKEGSIVGECLEVKGVTVN